MGKLFGRDRKTSGEEGRDLNDFLRGPSDRNSLTQRPPPGPPVLAKLDTSNVSRYPNAFSVTDGLPHASSLRSQIRSPGSRSRKGLVVRFVDTPPEIVGRGGDDTKSPTLEISKRKRARPPPPPPNITVPLSPKPADIITDTPPRTLLPEEVKATTTESFSRPLRRPTVGAALRSRPDLPPPPPKAETPTGYLGTPDMPRLEKRKSILEIQQAQMREAEGLAFANAVRSANSPIANSPKEPHSPLDLGPDLAQQAMSTRVLDPSSPISKSPLPPGTPPENRPRPPIAEESPSSVYSQSPSPVQYRTPVRQIKQLSMRDVDGDSAHSDTSPVKQTPNLHDVVVAASEEALASFVARTRHLFELFRLHSETVRPLMTSMPEDLTRAGLWWFLRGRMALEVAIRDRPSSPQHQQQNEFAKQQAYADLAKGYWLSEEVFQELFANSPMPLTGEVEEARKSLGSNLRKLTVSMKRNGFLPPEEAFLPQTVDKTVWVEYPKLSRDIVALLWGTSSTALSQMQVPTSGMSILEATPPGDLPFCFCFGRVHADVFLMEQGTGSQGLYLPCLLSVVRLQNQSGLVFVVASQDGTVQLRIQSKKNAGPTWEDVRWRSDSCSLDVRLPRGFALAIQCSQQDYRLIWSMYDFNSNVLATLYPKPDEKCVFRSTLRAFQYFDKDQQSRQFPRESVPNCEVALFERLLREGAATGPRTFHRGYRVAVVTGPRVKTVSGVNHAYLPQMPVQFGFLRGEQNDPALSLKFDNGRQKGSMVLSFEDEKERMRMHSLLVGTAVHQDEQVYSEVSLQAIHFSDRLGESLTFKSISSLPWERARIINELDGDGRPDCVLSEKLRVVFEFKEGSMTDRINVAPGELKVRLDAQHPTRLMVYRHAQGDLTLALAEAKMPRELAQSAARSLEQIQKAPSLRTYAFPSLAEMHRFLKALTGFKVLFDGIASTFAIARRRMVVPIHKKWEAGATRIQVVQQDGVSQLLAFFQDFTHGECMSFTLKGTDVFESFNKAGKVGIKFDDAKFPLPKSFVETDDIRTIADASFVCLDMPELPGEHDDISITFDSEAGKPKILPPPPTPSHALRDLYLPLSLRLPG